MGWGAALSGGMGIIGDIMNAQSQENTNLTNFQIAQMNNDFNAQQASLNRTFQQNMLGQVEQYDTGMANTQVTRRMQDLQNAGLNPQLAVGNPAAAPMVGAPSGSQASSAGNPIMQNPGAAFSQLGAQTAQALQTGANIQLAEAQKKKAEADAKLTTSQTPSDTNLDEYGNPTVSVGANHYLGDAALQGILKNNQLTQEEKQKTINLANYIIAQQYNTDAQTGGQNIANAVATTQYNILQATKNAYITEQLEAGARAKNELGVDLSTYGRGLSYVNRGLPVVNTAISAATDLGGLAIAKQAAGKAFGGWNRFNTSNTRGGVDISGGETQWPSQ